MGIDLRLFPVEADLGTGWGYSHTMLSLDRRSELWNWIAALHSVERPGWTLSAYAAYIPDGSMIGETCYGHVEKDAYDDPFRFIQAGLLADCMDAFHGKFQAMATPRNRAVAAYLRALPPETLVALYWH